MIYANSNCESWQFDEELRPVQISGAYDASGDRDNVVYDLSSFVDWYSRRPAGDPNTECKLELIKALLLGDEDVTPEFLRDVLSEAEKLYE